MQMIQIRIQPCQAQVFKVQLEGVKVQMTRRCVESGTGAGMLTMNEGSAQKRGGTLTGKPEARLYF